MRTDCLLESRTRTALIQSYLQKAQEEWVEQIGFYTQLKGLLRERVK